MLFRHIYPLCQPVLFEWLLFLIQNPNYSVKELNKYGRTSLFEELASTLYICQDQNCFCTASLIPV